MALGQEIAAQAVGDLAGVDPIVLLFGCGDGPLHQRMSYLDGAGMGQQMIVAPAGEEDRFPRIVRGCGRVVIRASSCAASRRSGLPDAHTQGLYKRPVPDTFARFDRVLAGPEEVRN